MAEKRKTQMNVVDPIAVKSELSGEECRVACSQVAERNQLLSDLARVCLESTGLFRNSDVRLEVRPDELVLCGTVPTWYEKQLAQETLREISDNVAIRNLIEVRQRPRSCGDVVSGRQRHERLRERVVVNC